MILHVDMDAFFAAVEQRDFPELRGKPVVVGGRPGGRGVVAACSYEARRFGVRSALPMSQALRLCPDAVVRRCRFDVYSQVGQAIRAIFARHASVVEPLSVDEAFLDVAGDGSAAIDAEAVGRRIKAEIAAEHGLTASVGAAPVKFLAKIASDFRKPDGFCLIRPEEVLDFLAPLPVGKLWGVGDATDRRLATLGIRTVGQLRTYPPEVLRQCLGRTGPHLWNLAHGIDPRRVKPRGVCKSVSNETTFATDLTDPAAMCEALRRLTDKVGDRLRKAKAHAAGVSLKIRFGDFRTITRAGRLAEPSDATPALWDAVHAVWNAEAAWRCGPIRLLGVAAIDLSRPKYTQLGLFDREEEEDEAPRTRRAVENVNR